MLIIAWIDRVTIVASFETLLLEYQIPFIFFENVDGHIFLQDVEKLENSNINHCFVYTMTTWIGDYELFH